MIHASDPKMVLLDTMWDQDPSLLCTRELAHFPARALTCALTQHKYLRTPPTACAIGGQGATAVAAAAHLSHMC